MKDKIKNWLEKHGQIYGMCLIGASLCAVAFGGAYLGANMAVSNMTMVVAVAGSDGIDTSLGIK